MPVTPTWAVSARRARRLLPGYMIDVLETERIITVANGNGGTGQAIEVVNSVPASSLTELLN